MTTKMFAPAGATGIVQASKSGQTYTIGTDGSIAANLADVLDLERAGFTMANRTSNSANGLASGVNLPLTNFKNADGTTLAAAAASGKFGLAITLGTSEVLAGEVANNNTKTDTVMTEYVLPANYVAGQDINLTVSSRIVIGGGTAGTKTLTAAAYRKAADGTQGANIIATAAATLSNAIAENTFVITGTTLNPGDVIAISLAAALQETASSAINAQINSVRLS